MGSFFTAVMFEVQCDGVIFLLVFGPTKAKRQKI